MSSKSYVLANEKKKVLVGHQYDGTEILKFAPSLHESNSVHSANPLAGRPGSNHRIDLHIRNENYNINEVLFEFDHVNLDGVLSQTVLHPFLLFQEIKVLFNDQLLVHLDNAEEIFATVANNMRHLSKDQFESVLQTCMVSNFATPLTGETVTAGSTYKWSVPFTTFLFPWLRDISPTDGVGKLTFEVKFVPNYGTATSVGRFMSSSTTNNPYTDATIRFDNIQIRPLVTRHRDPYLMTVPMPTIVIQRFAEKQFSLASWNSTSDSHRVQLSQEFSPYRICNGILLYITPTSNVTAYNDTDCMKVGSSADLLGWELRWKSRTILDFKFASDKGRKVKYYHDTYMKRHGKPLDTDMITGTTNKSNVWIPLTWVDLQSVANGSNDDDRNVYSGISNKDSDLELIIYNTQGAYCASSCILNVCLGYVEFFQLDPKTGAVREIVV